MSRASVLSLLASFASLTLLAPIGCAGATDDAPHEDAVESTEDALTSVAQSLVGRYYDAEVGFGGIGRLTLAPNGTYTAHVEAGGRAVCVASPCLLPESGKWNATKSTSGVLRLRLKAQGEPSRYYVAKKQAGELTLSRAGTTQTFAVLGQNECLDSADCSADQECGPKLCFMICLAGDPFCCGTSTCEPKAAPPPPAPSDCWGAWLDQNGVCRTPADGVYPDACCAGPKCGLAQCAAGEVCCNAAAGTCTPPGMACAQ